ncbi:FliM/FliN family flagellar motor switch protein [Ferrimonas balearica]|uniref:FliM/FliN family flagellar motor switch protein n=1 Tax=Ferrimonas balearica TaxID=44012 RepID=UPI001C56E56F|nr:flagellar motor switch protein FliM [Ferrimonas balearica]MBW3139432.1 FliM/FliN family flagellar motor C-terminal domain-containing protein [Ferrimonas balearica]MBW3162980.1 FliM/FliN family flagellar motor C-terminal domain-containing protein [Ferrimonas balearica]MBY6106500.1 FliM/FliN family flagellar motor C-terminal domain-containing protein [Ferrimonas balearica]
MKTTAKATVLRAADQHAYRPVALVQERLARSRLLFELEKRHRQVLDAVGQALTPGTGRGQSPLAAISAVHDNAPLGRELAWFQLSHERQPLTWWGIDRCSLDQLASSYYGGGQRPLSCPLTPPSQSELRLVKRLMVAALDALAQERWDIDALDLEVLEPGQTLPAPLRWQFDWVRESALPKMQWMLSDAALASLTRTPMQAPVAPDLAQRLKRRLHQLPIRLSCQLGGQSMPTEALAGLQPGEILPLTLVRRSPVAVGGRPIFHATVHAHEGQLVAKLTHELHQHED